MGRERRGMSPTSGFEGKRSRRLAASLRQIASISKPITAVAILQIIEQGKLKLEDKVYDILDLKEAICGVRSLMFVSKTSGSPDSNLCRTRHPSISGK